MTQPPAEPDQQRVRLEQRPRSVPFKRPIVGAVFFSALFYLSLAATLATLFACFALRRDDTVVILLFCIGINTILGGLSYLRRRVPRCPLCNGTPLVDSSARKHRDAKRFFPLSYGSSNVVRCIFRQRYICPYCGTPFDLLKPLDK